jgi:hypothetical protein
MDNKLSLALALVTFVACKTISTATRTARVLGAGSKPLRQGAVLLT